MEKSKEKYHNMLWKIINKYGKDKSISQIRKMSNPLERFQLYMCKRRLIRLDYIYMGGRTNVR